MPVRLPDNAPTLANLVGMEEFQNIFGPLRKDVQDRILRLLKFPANATWNDAHSIILRTGKGLGGGMTIWQAWIRLDPTAPKVGPTYDAKMNPGKWARIPTQEEVFWILRYAATLEVRTDGN